MSWGPQVKNGIYCYSVHSHAWLYLDPLLSGSHWSKPQMSHYTLVAHGSHNRCLGLISCPMARWVPQQLTTPCPVSSRITPLLLYSCGWWPTRGPPLIGPPLLGSPMGPLQDPWTRSLIKWARWSHCPQNNSLSINDVPLSSTIPCLLDWFPWNCIPFLLVSLQQPNNMLPFAFQLNFIQINRFYILLSIQFSIIHHLEHH